MDKQEQLKEENKENIFEIYNCDLNEPKKKKKEILIFDEINIEQTEI